MLWGTGVAIGSWAAGEVWDVATAPLVFTVAAALCLLALAILRQPLPAERVPRPA
jgi:PPP family 3-phenylpropionic acid transporter